MNDFKNLVNLTVNELHKSPQYDADTNYCAWEWTNVASNDFTLYILGLDAPSFTPYASFDLGNVIQHIVDQSENNAPYGNVWSMNYLISKIQTVKVQ